EYVGNARGVRCVADQVIVVGGTQQGLDLVARVLLEPGDAAWVEDPGYPDSVAALRAAGARPVPVPVDDEGLDVSAGERLSPGARLAHVTPSHQFPLGSVMSIPRRMALLAWARRARAWVFEDDYDSEFRYTGRPLPSLQGLDVERRPAATPACVVYAGTFNKTLVPTLRLGYLIVPGELVDPLRSARAVIDRHAPSFEQVVLADFIGEGHYVRHLRRMRALYAERQAELLAAADALLSGRLTLEPDAAGLHLVGWLPADSNDVAASARAREAGVETYPLTRFRLTPCARESRGALLLGYAPFDREAIRDGARR
ncbi:MAG: aminotransferase class I/II-fold pyridoxal phosphate-dependent enzyme, partial [Gammaproteobacteria bacterium]|nr:aminotransferase class I/II-fold pyridoxal phosphate-dependent enzyme [Gammaproteobacteria bacterium]